MNNHVDNLNSWKGLELHCFSEADLVMSTLTIGTIVTVTSDLRKDSMINLGSVLQKGSTLM